MTYKKSAARGSPAEGIKKPLTKGGAGREDVAALTMEAFV